MKLQRFVGKNTKSVLDEIRTILGDEALIVSNTKVGSKTEIIAASEGKRSDAESTAKVYADLQASPTQEERFAGAIATQRYIDAKIRDPWIHIKSINDEIRSIKSSLNQLPAANPRTNQSVMQSIEREDKEEMSSQDPLQILKKTSQGCNIVWGE